MVGRRRRAVRARTALRLRSASRAALVALVGATLSAACGLDIAGVPPSGEGGSRGADASLPLDAGSDALLAPTEKEDGAVTDAGALADGSRPTFCERARAADGGVSRCLDFEGAGVSTTPFGFEEVRSTAPAGSTTLEVSPSAAFGEGRSFRAGFAEFSPAGTQDVTATWRVLDGANFGATKSLSFEVDVRVESFTTTYAVLAIVHVLGTSCADPVGFAIRGNSFVDPTANTVPIGAFNVGTSYRLAIVFRPNTTPPSSELFIDGVSVRTRETSNSPTCQAANVQIGTFFTGLEGRAVVARFDNLLLRTVP